MSTIAKNLALVALGAAGAVVAVNQMTKPSTSEGLGGAMRRVKKEYNATIHPEQDRSDTIFDRTKIMNDVKARKPWNMTYAEKQRLKDD